MPADRWYRTRLDTPLGAMHVAATDRGASAVFFLRQHHDMDRHRRQWFRSEGEDVLRGKVFTGTPLHAACVALERYFAGDPAAAAAVPLDLRGTAFQQRVWHSLRSIRPGATVSYGAIARAVGCPGAARAVGGAVGRNPVAIIVPCHRVIGADGTLTGFGGGLRAKEWLLQHEARCVAGSFAARQTAPPGIDAGA